MTPRLLLVAALAALGAAAAPAARAQVDATTMRANFIDVGQGDATLLEFSCGVVMIDAGGQDEQSTAALLAYLHNFFGTRPELRDTIRAVYITHGHIDHTRALRRVVEEFHVPRVIENGKRGSSRDQGDATLRWLEDEIAHGRHTDRIDVDDEDVVQTVAGLTGPDLDPVNCAGTDPDIRILAADREDNPGWTQDDFKDKNNHSLVLRVDFGSASFLFTGDLESAAQESLVQRYASSGLLDTDVYHVGHHGSYNGTTTDLLDAIVRPKVAVISMGHCTDHGTWTAWAYGHPRVDAVNRLRHAILRRRTPQRVLVAESAKHFSATMMRDAVFATGWDGTIVLTARANGTYRTVPQGTVVPESC